MPKRPKRANKREQAFRVVLWCCVVVGGGFEVKIDEKRSVAAVDEKGAPARKEVCGWRRRENGRRGRGHWRQQKGVAEQVDEKMCDARETKNVSAAVEPRWGPKGLSTARAGGDKIVHARDRHAAVEQVDKKLN